MWDQIHYAPTTRPVPSIPGGRNSGYFRHTKIDTLFKAQTRKMTPYSLYWYPVQRHIPMGVPPPPPPRRFSCCLADSSCCRLEDRASYLFISLCFSYFGASLCHATKTKTTKTKKRLWRAIAATCVRSLSFTRLLHPFCTFCSGCTLLFSCILYSAVYCSGLSAGFGSAGQCATGQ